MASATNLANLVALALSAPLVPTVYAEIDSRIRYELIQPTSSEAAIWFGFRNEEFGTATSSKAPFDNSVPRHAEIARSTTAQEEIVGEIRNWASLQKNWDGEGAEPPVWSSLEEAVSFVNLLRADRPLPEAMLHPNGRSGLYWNDGSLYADLEFTGDGRATYYIEHRGIGKHKGVVTFDGKQMPAVFATLLRG